ncbi:hypothetical protein MBM_02358 [Drepanopeziza brunnea f. sp. 'multigermtubi' MB_m1]|uniref:Uncharacterized protein n=1 Tax=Marssonina brunnea f. sp. multigermtubi (strain MB_m1) TaxID=1072389 RepID=K1X1N4_MARBU|nr:uncharacterized protein MBM_02358 [Drepanopeziza brunnea f. sp. 'multigermtubi' MB_m1]EKD19121.1 hypothetical protein MBM_02358 [Drepanopeziza brunnea f. sp. 'multigermtubi' MB_m1]
MSSTNYNDRATRYEQLRAETKRLEGRVYARIRTQDDSTGALVIQEHRAPARGEANVYGKVIPQHKEDLYYQDWEAVTPRGQLHAPNTYLKTEHRLNEGPTKETLRKWGVELIPRQQRTFTEEPEEVEQ